MNVTSLITVDYENIANCQLGENKPNTNPIKANTKPIKAKTNPIQTQNEPNQTQFHPPGIEGFCFFETPIMTYALQRKRIKNPL